MWEKHLIFVLFTVTVHGAERPLARPMLRTSMSSQIDSLGRQANRMSWATISLVRKAVRRRFAVVVVGLFCTIHGVAVREWYRRDRWTANQTQDLNLIFSGVPVRDGHAERKNSCDSRSTQTIGDERLAQLHAPLHRRPVAVLKNPKGCVWTVRGDRERWAPACGASLGKLKAPRVTDSSKLDRSPATRNCQGSDDESRVD